MSVAGEFGYETGDEEAEMREDGRIKSKFGEALAIEAFLGLCVESLPPDDMEDVLNVVGLLVEVRGIANRLLPSFMELSGWPVEQGAGDKHKEADMMGAIGGLDPKIWEEATLLERAMEVWEKAFHEEYPDRHEVDAACTVADLVARRFLMFFNQES